MTQRDPARLSFINDALGIAYSLLTQEADFIKSEKYFKDALSSRKINKHKYFEGFTHHNLGLLYKRWKKFDKAIEEVVKAINIFKRLKKYDLGDAYFTLAKIYLMKSDSGLALTNFKKAEENFKTIYSEQSEKFRCVEFEIKKINHGEEIPFEKIKYLTEAGEFRFHDWLRENVTVPDISLIEKHIGSEGHLNNLADIVIQGVSAGDDAAVLRIPHSSKYDLLITTDAAPGSLTSLPILGDIDQDSRHRDIERGKYAAKFSVVHCISDIYAMGGIPIAILLNFYLTRDATFEYATNVIQTMQEEARKYGVCIIGGDLKERNNRSIGSVGVGLVEKDKAICRSGANIGDILAITLTQGIKLGTRWTHEIIKYRHLEDQFKKFIAKNYLDKHLLLPDKEMAAAAQTGHLTSAIDTSDGIFACLKLIGKSSKAGFILEEKLMKEIVHPEVDLIARNLNLNPIQFIINAGHDWEMVVTVRQNEFEKVREVVKMTGGDLAPIGRVVAKNEIEEGTVKIIMVEGKRINLPYFTDEKFVQSPYQNRIQEWFDLKSFF